MASRSGRRLVALALALVALAVLIRTLGAKPASEAPVATQAPSREAARTAPPPPVAAASAETRRALIASVEPERSDPCAGESVLVRVRTHDVGRPIAVRVQSVDGTLAAVSFATPGEQVLRVLATTDDHEADVRTVPMHVRDCGELPRLDVHAEEAPDGVTWRFAARPAPVGGDKLSWDFGDGSHVSGGAYVEHVFPRPDAGELESHFLVRAEVDSHVHGTIRGYANVTRINANEMNKRLARVVAPVAHVAAVTRVARGFSLELRVRNPEPKPLQLAAADIVGRGCGGGREEQVRSHANQLFDDPELPPGESVRHVRVEDRLTQYCSLLFMVSGTTAEGLGVSLRFGADLKGGGRVVETLDPDRIDAGSAEAKKLARFERALKLLGRDISEGGASVTDDEMRRLELQGLLPPAPP